MKTIISIGTDGKILEGGRVYDRVKEYAGLVEGKYYCFIFTNDDKKVKFQKEDGNFILRAVYGRSKISQVINLFKVVGELIKKEREVILYPQDSFEIGLISLFLKYWFGKTKLKLYTQCHTDISHPNFRNLSKRNCLQYLIAQVVFRKADKIRVVSNRMKKYLVEELKIDENKVVSLPIYFDSPHLNPPPSGEEIVQKVQKFDFLIMSRIEKEKNIEAAIEALAPLSNGEGQGERVLKIVGSGTYKKNLQEKYSGEKYKFITWSDWTDNPMQEYQNAKYFLLPSFYEGWGLTAIESVSCGTPVVMTNVGCAHEVVKNFENGIVSEGFDAKSFKGAILRALNTEFSKEKLRQSVLNLNSKQEYLDILKKFLSK